MPESDTRLVAGLMTGTSIDAIDAALVRISGRGPGITCDLLRTTTRTLGELTDPLRRLADGESFRAHDIVSIADELARKHVRAVSALLDGASCDLICVHGQTVYHRPPLSWQLMNATPVAIGLQTPVVFDLRAADLAAGGQGAPITPIADFVLFRDTDERRAIVNFGGFCNVTILPAAPEDDSVESTIAKLKARDVCACNQLLDGVARARFGEAFDTNGERAATGVVDEAALIALGELLAAQAGANRSLGSGDELGEWIAAYAGELPGEDQARTACSAVAATIAEAVEGVDRILVAGGGVQNRTLLEELRAQADSPIDLTDECGVPASYREAVAMAVLGALCEDRVPITLPQVTGVNPPPPVAGVWVHPS